MNISLLKEICEVAGAPGFEERVRKLVLKEIDGLVDEVKVDNMGNVIAIKKAYNVTGPKKLMVSAHMDEIGFIVTHIDDKGFLRFHTLGGFDPKTLTSQRVIVHGKKDIVGVMGSKPIHVMSPEERGKAVKSTDFFIDLGMSKEEVDKIVSVGDSVTRDRELIEMGNCVNCKSLDNRVSVFILIETLKKLKGKQIPVDFYAVFSVQEEVGLRGAKMASHAIDPDFGLGLDTTIAFDVPGAAAHEKITSLGEGVAIKLMDTSAIADVRMVRYLKAVATTNDVNWQVEILTGGGTDTAAIQSMSTNAIVGALSIPTRHIHQVIEMCDKDDIQATIDLLEKAVVGIGEFDSSF